MLYRILLFSVKPQHESAMKSEVAQSCPTLATPCTVAYQGPLSMGFSRQEYWSGVPLPSLPFRYKLNQIPFDYTVKVRNRFKGLDLIVRVPDELWNEVCDIVQETGIMTIPMEN